MQRIRLESEILCTAVVTANALKRTDSEVVVADEWANNTRYGWGDSLVHFSFS